MNGKDATTYSGSDAYTRQQTSPIECPLAAEDSTVYLVRFVHTSETALGSYEEARLRHSQYVIALSRFGRDLARVLGSVNPACAPDSETVMPIVRIASAEDIAEYGQGAQFEGKSLGICRQRVENHGLKMKVLSTHFLPEEKKLLFFFTADGRVDFRELVRDLVATFRMRIELRQIGVRDETKLLGGMGICGRVLCCHSYPNQMCSVSIKMAKEQNLSLGSMKVSGPCGRLMCCLSYEYDYYTSERGKYPKHGIVVTGPTTSYAVVDVNMISRTVLLAAQEGGMLAVPLEQFTYNSKTSTWHVDPLPAE